MKWPFANPSEFADRSGDSLPLRAPREWSNADRSSGDAILKRSILFLRRRAATSNPVLRMADGPRGPGNPGDAGIKGCGLHINLATTAGIPAANVHPLLRGRQPIIPLRIGISHDALTPMPACLPVTARDRCGGHARAGRVFF